MEKLQRNGQVIRKDGILSSTKAASKSSDDTQQNYGTNYSLVLASKTKLIGGTAC